MRMKEKARSLKKDLFVVDTGDTHDGNGLSDVTSPHGKITQPMLAHVPYDLLTIGNHELYTNDVIEDVYYNFMPNWRGRYLASNVYFKDVHSGKTVPFGDKYTYFEGEFGTRVLAFGFLFDFQNNDNTSVIQTAEDEIEKPWFTEALTSHTPDMIVLIGHTGIRSKEFTVVQKAIREHFPVIPIAVLGGHKHVRDFAIYDGRSAGIASGRFMETIGFFSIQDIQPSTRLIEQKEEGTMQSPANLTFFRRYLDQNRATYLFHTLLHDTDKEDGKETSRFDTVMGKSISKNITEWRAKLDLMNTLGCAPQNYYRTDVPANDSASIFKLTVDEVLPKVVTNSARTNAPYYIFDTGTLRYDIFKGAFTMDNVNQVSPFTDRYGFIADIPRETALKIVQLANDATFDPGNAKRSYDADVWTCDDSGFRGYLQRSTVMTPGYTTKDDLGTDGDDTKHLPRPSHSPPHFVASKLPDTPLVDIVFTDFSSSFIQQVANQIAGKQLQVEPVYTSDPNIRSNTLWVEFVKKYWSKNCT
ncbi:Metallo-dependent phosphatase-like protein [Zychaea mexicana]|uniref:Metallo-dependent phosphatase-like protein n=1 Tax=Zychaea mexicana TaxID=64656 RepID=UPI0022FE3857|nr:Metallo-dependent phosphatase-like protein [Zychaea mexicana]KAI9495704.1 Metallo-dependent phosphatase-like protein [Zychaea mexicana]